MVVVRGEGAVVVLGKKEQPRGKGAVFYERPIPDSSTPPKRKMDGGKCKFGGTGVRIIYFRINVKRHISCVLTILSALSQFAV